LRLVPGNAAQARQSLSLTEKRGILPEQPKRATEGDTLGESCACREDQADTALPSRMKRCGALMSIVMRVARPYIRCIANH